MKASSRPNFTDANLGSQDGPREPQGMIISGNGRVLQRRRGICSSTAQILESRGRLLQAVISSRIMSPWLQLLCDTLLFNPLGVSIEFEWILFQNRQES
jgi:hypothetical protein